MLEASDSQEKNRNNQILVKNTEKENRKIFAKQGGK